MSSQLERWQGDFGRAYLERNQVDWRTRRAAFRRLLPLPAMSIIEVGANRGHNLQAIRSVLGPKADLRGVEPSMDAIAASIPCREMVVQGTIYDIPFPDGTFALAFTSGVLTHVPPERLDDALSELYRVSRRYLLSIEYAADEDEVVHYRGHDDMLWKRDYLEHWWRLYPRLRLVEWGALTKEDGFDDARYWLMEKRT